MLILNVLFLVDDFLLQLVVLFYINTGDTDNDFKYGALIFFGISIFILLIV